MPAFDQKFSEDQCDAAAEARVDRGLTLRRVSELAAAGDLELRGPLVPPVKISQSYVRDLANRLVRQRTGRAVSPLAEQAAPDANEALRRRLVNLSDAMLRAEEKKKPATVDPERLRQIARAVREAEQIRGAQGGTPPPRTSRDEHGKQHLGQSSGGLAGAMMRDLRATERGEAAQKTTPTNTDHGDTDGAGTAPPFERAEGDTDTTPGALVTERIRELQPERFDLQP
jgi:hypothetical protein